MARNKRRLTRTEKRTRAERRKKYMWVMMNGKQVRVLRPHTIDGMSVQEFIDRNADPIWLHQNGMWEIMQDDTGSTSMAATDGHPQFGF